MAAKSLNNPPHIAGRAPAVTQLIPVTRWNESHTWPSVGGLRHLIFFAKTNGFEKVLRRIGRRVLIDEAAFFEWASKHGGSV
jgi:hypothetical protein